MTYTSRMAITSIVESLRASLLDTAGVVTAYLFGSMARGDGSAESDVDVAILLDHQPRPSLESMTLDLEARLERLLGRPVQIVVLNRASPDLVHRVLRDGQILVDRDRPRRLRFEVQARNEYFDIAPVLRRYREVS